MPTHKCGPNGYTGVGQASLSGNNVALAGLLAWFQAFLQAQSAWARDCQDGCKLKSGYVAYEPARIDRENVTGFLDPGLLPGNTLLGWSVAVRWRLLVYCQRETTLKPPDHAVMLSWSELEGILKAALGDRLEGKLEAVN